MGRGWFGVIPEPGVDHKRVELDHEVVLLVDHDGHVAAVSWPDGKITDSVLFSVLRSLRFETAQQMGCIPRVAVGAAYTLNGVEQLAVQEAAEGRHRACRSASVPNGRRNPAGDLATDLEGLAGEFAFCRLFNVYPDFVIGVRPPFDAMLPGGWRVDVKTTWRSAGRLLVLPGKLNDGIDLYALMVGSFPGPYAFRGFALREAVESRPIEDVGHGPTWKLDQAELVAFDRAWRRTVAA